MVERLSEKRFVFHRKSKRRSCNRLVELSCSARVFETSLENALKQEAMATQQLEMAKIGERPGMKVMRRR